MTFFSGDLIELTGIRVHAHHGVFEFERETGQLFIVDVTIAIDLQRSAHTDELGETVNYADVADRVVEVMQKQPLDLIETAASRVAEAVLRFAGVNAVRVTVHKPEAPLSVRVDDVSVTVVRQRERGAVT